MSVVIPTEDLRVFFDAQSRSWDSRMIRDPDLLRCLLAWLPLQSGDSVLDVGTGTGVLLPYIREIAPQGEIDAVDISSGMLAVAQDKYGDDAHIHFISADVSKDMLPRRYHAIILYSVFPHLSRRDETVARLISDYCLLHIPREGSGSMLCIAAVSVPLYGMIYFRCRYRRVVFAVWD